MRVVLSFLMLLNSIGLIAQIKRTPVPLHEFVSKVWLSDQGDGSYKNPIINADYSDPDAIRVGKDYYMVASSFDAVPGLPILHSKDLVNWSLVGHALNRLVPEDHYAKVQHGNGVWAPAIRFHQNEFLIYYPDPDFGIFLVRAKHIEGPWSAPVLVEAGKGLIDPCPFWDDNGKGYLVHAYAGSRAGIKSVLVLKSLSDQGDKTEGEAKLIYDGHDLDPTVEGPKMYKRNGFYYVFAPAGGVSTGWQLVLRSKKIEGPYERKVVMEQGKSKINGPHQGAWLNTPEGVDWFIHFQDKGLYGRVVLLQPMIWENDWPVIGSDRNHTGTGNPVSDYKKPVVGKAYPEQTPQDSDEFDSARLGKQWQWQANPTDAWIFPNHQKGVLRFNAVPRPDKVLNAWEIPAVLLQKFPAEEFKATTAFSFQPKVEGEHFSFLVMGKSYAGICIEKMKDSLFICYENCMDADKGNQVIQRKISSYTGTKLWFRITVKSKGKCTFSYSTDGLVFQDIEDVFIAVPGKWIGAKLGFCDYSPINTNDGGFTEIDWIRFEPLR